MDNAMEGIVFRGCQLPPGFRFQPTDQEIIVCYLKNKIASTEPAITSIVAGVDIYKFEPWDLPDKAVFGEGEWFFFSPRDRKYPNGARPNRTAGSGYWKATGTDKPILAGGGARCLGVKKALVFYQGRSPRGTKTEWVMHEYRLLDADAHHKPNADSMRLDDWVLCRVRKKGAAFELDTEGNSAPPSRAVVPPATNYRAGKEAEAAAATGVQAPPNAAGVFDDVWTDGQLLQYLVGGGSVHHDAAGSVGGLAGHHQGGFGDTAPDGLASVLENIKRNLSLQAMEDVYLLQPSKRANCMRDDDDMMSPSTSLSTFDTDS